MIPRILAAILALLCGQAFPAIVMIAFGAYFGGLFIGYSIGKAKWKP